MRSRVKAADAALRASKAARLSQVNEAYGWLRRKLRARRAGGRGTATRPCACAGGRCAAYGPSAAKLAWFLRVWALLAAKYLPIGRRVVAKEPLQCLPHTLLATQHARCSDGLAVSGTVARAPLHCHSELGMWRRRELQRRISWPPERAARRHQRGRAVGVGAKPRNPPAEGWWCCELPR